MPITARLSDWYTNLSTHKKWIVKLLGVLTLVLIVAYIWFMPLRLIHMDLPIATSSDLARQGSHELWTALHGDDISNLEAIIEKLTRAYEVNDTDETLIALLGGAHIWRFSMRNRLGKTAEEMQKDLELGVMYAERNMKLYPENRTSTAPSMAATSNWQLAVINDDQKLLDTTHMKILANSEIWPEFAAFMQGWILAAMLEPSDEFYATDHLGYMFMLDQCAGFRLPDAVKFNKFMHSMYSIKSLTKPECYNNTIAPHSIEGTLLSVGDAWVKEGKYDLASVWYNNAKTSPTYDSWKYKDLLEDRLARLEYFENKFVADSGKLDVEEPAMSYQSEISCGLCHTH